MELIENGVDGSGRTILVVKQGFFGKKRKYIASKEPIAKGYWNWLELPKKLMVPDYFSFQLDAWKRELDAENKSK